MVGSGWKWPKRSVPGFRGLQAPAVFGHLLAVHQTHRMQAAVTPVALQLR